MKLIGTAIDRKSTDEDGNYCVGCRTAMWEERRNHHILISEQQPKYYGLIMHIAFFIGMNNERFESW